MASARLELDGKEILVGMALMCGIGLIAWLISKVWQVSAATIAASCLALTPLFLFVAVLFGLAYLIYRTVVGNIAYSRRK